MQQRLQLNGNDSESDETSTGNFAKYLQATRKIKIKYPSTVSLVVKDAALDAFWKGNKLAMPHIEFEVEDTASTETPKPKVTLVLRMRIAKGQKNDSTAIMTAKLHNKELPDYVTKVKCQIGVFCPQINYLYQTSTTVSKKATGILLCDSVKLEGLDAFEWKMFVKFRARLDKNN